MTDNPQPETGNYSGIHCALTKLRETDMDDPSTVHDAINTLLWIGREAAEYQYSYFYKGNGWEKGDLDAILELYGRKIQRLSETEGVKRGEAQRVFSSCMTLASCLDLIVEDLL